MNIKSEFEYQEEYYNSLVFPIETEKCNRGGRKQIKTGTTKRNARERNRVRYINYCFDVLRQHIPSTSEYSSEEKITTISENSDLNRKLSKVETLKFAAKYIKQLTSILEQQQQQNQDDETNDDFEYHNMITPSTSPFSGSSTTSSSINQQQFNNDYEPMSTTTTTETQNSPYYYPPTTNITLNNININIFNENQQQQLMQVDGSFHNSQVCSYSANQNFMENQYYNYQCYY
jgi:hypothetical protein